MQKLSLPLSPARHPIGEYIERVVRPYQSQIQSVYFALPGSIVPSARASEAFTLKDVAEIVEALSKIGVEPYVVLNSSWTPYNAVAEDSIKGLLSTLTTLRNHGLIGLTCTNNLLMNTGALREVPGLKVQASVNQYVDNFQKAEMLVKYLGYDGIIWDRNINLNIDHLKATNLQLKAEFPQVFTTIMVNEGCMGRCPFQREHAVRTSMFSSQDPDWVEHQRQVDAKTPGLTRKHNIGCVEEGCSILLRKYPELKKEIPFIRSDELDAYEDCADIIKISGREQSLDWIVTITDAYINRKPFCDEFLDAKVLRS